MHILHFYVLTRLAARAVRVPAPLLHAVPVLAAVLLLGELEVALLSIRLGFVVLHLHLAFKFFALDALQLLRLNNVAQVALIAILLQLLQQVQLVLLQLLNAAVQATDGREHLVVLALVPVALLLGLHHLGVLLVHDRLELLHSLLILQQRLLKLASCRNRLHRQPLLPLHLARQVLHLLLQVRILFSSFQHLSLLRLVLRLQLLARIRLLPKHFRQQVRILSNLLQLLSQVFLVRDCVLQLRLIHLPQRLSRLLLLLILPVQLRNLSFPLFPLPQHLLLLQNQILIHRLQLIYLPRLIVNLTSLSVILRHIIFQLQQFLLLLIQQNP